MVWFIPKLQTWGRVRRGKIKKKERIRQLLANFVVRRTKKIGQILFYLCANYNLVKDNTLWLCISASYHCSEFLVCLISIYQQIHNYEQWGKGLEFKHNKTLIFEICLSLKKEKSCSDILDGWNAFSSSIESYEMYFKLCTVLSTPAVNSTEVHIFLTVIEASGIFETLNRYFNSRLKTFLIFKFTGRDPII